MLIILSSNPCIIVVMNAEEIESSAGDRPSVVIAAGGTGGHIYPGLALADAIRTIDPDRRICFVGTRRGLESSLIPAAGYPLRMIDMVPLKKSPWPRRFLFPAVLAGATRQAARVLKRENAAVAVGMGGYASAPLIVGAAAAGVPSIIHESGAIAGRANTFAALFTKNVAVALEGTNLRGGQVVGMPLRSRRWDHDPARARELGRERLGVDDRQFVILVSGGSLGAQRLNDAATDLAIGWKDHDDVRILIKAGNGRAADLNASLAEAGADKIATAVDYIEDMELAYRAADLALCRAGAGTIAELACMGTPAILVPYPHAPHDHQTHNAQTLARRGAAMMVSDDDMSGRSLAELVGSLMNNPDRLSRMATAAIKVSLPDAADRLARWVLRLADQKSIHHHERAGVR